MGYVCLCRDKQWKIATKQFASNLSGLAGVLYEYRVKRGMSVEVRPALAEWENEKVVKLLGDSWISVAPTTG